MRLFRENGFDTTTVAEVAEAADVSAMTVFRHFPTKEHLVMEDDYDPLIAERVRRRRPVNRSCAASPRASWRAWTNCRPTRTSCSPGPG